MFGRGSHGESSTSSSASVEPEKILVLGLDADGCMNTLFGQLSLAFRSLIDQCKRITPASITDTDFTNAIGAIQCLQLDLPHGLLKQVWDQCNKQELLTNMEALARIFNHDENSSTTEDSSLYDISLLSSAGTLSHNILKVFCQCIHQHWFNYIIERIEQIGYSSIDLLSTSSRTSVYSDRFNSLGGWKRDPYTFSHSHYFRPPTPSFFITLQLLQAILEEKITGCHVTTAVIPAEISSETAAEADSSEKVCETDKDDSSVCGASAGTAGTAVTTVTLDSFVLADYLPPFSKTALSQIQAVCDKSGLAELATAYAKANTEAVTGNGVILLDDSKVFLLYASLHRVAAAHPNQQIDYVFFDDREDILNPLHTFFSAHRDWIPSNIHLCFKRYPIVVDESLWPEVDTEAIGASEAKADGVAETKTEPEEAENIKSPVPENSVSQCNVKKWVGYFLWAAGTAGLAYGGIYLMTASSDILGIGLTPQTSIGQILMIGAFISLLILSIRLFSKKNNDDQVEVRNPIFGCGSSGWMENVIQGTGGIDVAPNLTVASLAFDFNEARQRRGQGAGYYTVLVSEGTIKKSAIDGTIHQRRFLETESASPASVRDLSLSSST